MEFNGIFAQIGAPGQKENQLPFSLVSETIRLGICENTLGLDQFQSAEIPIHTLIDGHLSNSSELSSRWTCAKNSSAAEIISNGFLKEGINCFAQLSGPFSIVLYDKRDSSLYFLRDPLAQRTLYYSNTDTSCIVSSSIQLIHSVSDQEFRLNKGYLAEYLLDVIKSPSETLWGNINRIEPGCFAKWTAGSLNIHRYWQPSVDTLHTHSLADAAEELSQLLSDSMINTPFAKDKLAISFSGGIDSTSLAAIAAESPEPKLFSLLFTQSDADESRYIKLARDHLKLRYTDIPARIPETDWLDSQLRDSLDLPVEPNGWFTHLVRQEARSQGIDSLITGYGGDELCAGSSSNNSITGLSRLAATLYDNPFVGSIKAKLKPLLPSLRWYPNWCTSKFYTESNIEERLTQGTYVPEHFSSYQSSVWDMLVGPYAIQLRDCEQRESIADGIVSIHPFYSKEVVEFLLKAPNPYLNNGTQTKIILREAIKNKLPQEYLSRNSKAEFSFIWIDSLRAFYSEKPRLEALADTKWFDVKDLQIEITEHLQLDSVVAKNNVAKLNRIWKILIVNKLLESHKAN